MAKHALLSASGASRWLACTPSARLEENIPQRSSMYAEEGTFAHKLAELEAKLSVGLISRTTHAKKLREYMDNPFFSTEMHEHARAYAEHVREKFETILKVCPDALIEFEVKVDFSEYVPGGFGTCDCAIIADDLLMIVDLKYGKGVRVEAYENPQMRLYAIGAYAQYSSLYSIRRVEMTIFQPCLYEGITTDELTTDELLGWATCFVKPKALLASHGEGEFTPSDEACKFCRARETCKARADKNLELFDDCPDPMLLTLEEAAEYLKRAKDLTAWFEDLKHYVTTSLLEGKSALDWKLVEGRSNRKIVDEIGAVSTLNGAGLSDDDIYDLKLKGITALEKLLGKKRFEELLTPYVEKPAGAPTLVPSTDKRKEYQPDQAIIDMFTVVEVEE